MVGIVAEILRMGVSVAEFCRESRISFVTIKRIDSGKKVRSDILARAQNTLDALREKRSAAAV